MLGKWYLHEDKFVYVLGLTADRFDYYYMVIDNKNYRLKFITCVYNLEHVKVHGNDLTDNEKKIIKSYINQYFIDHNTEQLLYCNL